MELPINQIICGDCIEVMRVLPDNSIDMILCDLPYGITACNWDSIIPFEYLWEQYRRIAKPTAVIVLTANQPFTSMLVMSNIDMFKYEWIWSKSISTGFLNANIRPLKKHESILVFGKEKGIFNPQFLKGKPYKAISGSTTQHSITKDPSITCGGHLTVSDGRRYPVSILEFNSENGIHPTQKPVALFEYLILTYSNEGDIVLDNCIGSGTTAIAAIRTNRNYIGIDISKEYVELSRQRIHDATRQVELFSEAI